MSEFFFNLNDSVTLETGLFSGGGGDGDRGIVRGMHLIYQL